jgi:hypothetical protein
MTYQKRAFRSSTEAILAALTVGLIAACGSDGGGKTEVDAGQNPGPDSSAPADSSVTDSKVTPSDTGTTDTPDGGKSDAAIVDAGKGTAPTLTTATAKQVGRFGYDLRVDLTATDPDKDITSVSISLFDKNAAAIGTERIVPLDTAITTATGSSSVTLAGVLEQNLADFGVAKVTLIDGRMVRSATLDATIATQAVVAENAACDATFVANRCGTGFGCKGAGTSKTCSAGVPPTLSRVGYFKDDPSLPPRIVIEGSDPDGDVATYTIRFLNSSSAEVPYDLDGDPTTPSVATFTTTVGDTDGATDFFFRFTPSDDFVNPTLGITRIGVKVSDGRATNNTSAEKISEDLKASPPKSSGAGCDLHGFDYCKGTTMAPLVCTPTSATAGSCKTVTAARTSACSAATVVRPSGSGTFSVTGKLSLASLWDAPEGCSSAKNTPDSLIKLVLDVPATKVTLTTNVPYTSFDSDLYVLEKCDQAPVLTDPRTPATTDPWCLADAYTDGSPSGRQPTLVLNNVAAEDYFVVIDSYPWLEAPGELFQLNVTVE